MNKNEMFDVMFDQILIFSFIFFQKQTKENIFLEP